MSRSFLRLWAAAGLVACAAGASAMVGGCGGIDCHETATCVEDRDSEPPDTSIEDVLDTSMPDGPTDGGDATLPEGDASDGDSSDADADAADADAADVHDGDARLDAADAADAGDGCDENAIEDCTNGKDDNCNGAIDCADIQCQSGFMCVPDLPGGFIGPVALFNFEGGAPAQSPPNCAAPYDKALTIEHNTPVAAPAVCSCTCGAPQGATCSPPSAGLYTAVNSCSASPPPFSGTLVAAPGCQPLANQGGINDFMFLSTGVASGGMCQANQSATPPAWNSSTGWATTGEICGFTTPHAYPTTNGCPSGQICVEKPPAPLTSPKLCVYTPGAAPCPSPYNATFTYYDGGTEGRICSGTCGCGAPSGINCNSAVKLLSGTCASGTNPLVISATGCQMGLNNYGNGAVSASYTQAPDGGSCAPASTLQPSGNIVPANPITVCCQP